MHHKTTWWQQQSTDNFFGTTNTTTFISPQTHQLSGLLRPIQRSTLKWEVDSVPKRSPARWAAQVARSVGSTSFFSFSAPGARLVPRLVNRRGQAGNQAAAAADHWFETQTVGAGTGAATASNTKATEVTSLAITKLDGTAKGGVVIGISDQLQIPVKYIGVGEAIQDLQVFNKYEFVDSFFNRS